MRAFGMLAVCAGLIVSAEALPHRIATMSELISQLDRTSAVDSPDGLESDPDLEPWRDWRRAWLPAKLALVAGNVAAFRDRLRALEESNLQRPFAYEDLAELYGLAAFVGVGLHDPVRLGFLLEQVERGFEERPVRLLHSNRRVSLRLPKWRIVVAGYHYSRGDAAALGELLKPGEEGSTPGSDERFVDAYVAFLLADLEPSPASAMRALRLLERSRADATEGQELGLPALFLGRTHLLLYELTSDVVHLDRARDQANIARQHLELLEVPVLWGKAMYLTYQELDARVRRSASEEGDTQLLRARRDRAYSLSVPYR